jgi:hypothetical protein
MTDPVTAARERLERLLPDVLRYDPVSMPAFDQRIDALIEAVRAEAGGVSVEALLDAWEAQEHPSIDAAIQAALAARSAESGSRVEAEVATDLKWSVARTLSDLVSKRLPEHRGGDLIAPSDVELALLGVHHRMPTSAPPTPPPAVDGTRVDPRQRTGNIGGPAVADHFARPTPPPAVDGTPTDAVEAAYQALLAMGHPVRARSGDTLVGLLRDDGFDIVPRTPPAPAVDGTRCGFRLGCGGRPDDPQHQRPFSGWGSMTAHDFEPNTPPPAVDDWYHGDLEAPR